MSDEKKLRPKSVAVEPTMMTIAIPTFNRVAAVTKRVEEILALELPSDVQILVVDNHSFDRTYDELMKRFGNRGVRILQNEHNRGYAGNFFRVIAEASSEYVVILSDEDRLEAAGFRDLMEFCRQTAPLMVSPRAQVGTNTRYRGREHTRPIDSEEFRSASFYLSGLTFATQASKDAIRVIESLVPDNSAATVYPQVLLTALLVAQSGGYFFDGLISTQQESLETTITDPSGSTYRDVSGRWAQFRGFEAFFAMDHRAIVAEAELPRLDTMRERVRADIHQNLAAAAVAELPDLKIHFRELTIGQHLSKSIVRALRRLGSR